LLLVPFLAALLAHRFTSGVLSGIGLLLVAVGLAWLGHALAANNGNGLIAPMLLIGTGIGLPWGLMDAMAVSVVEKERAGMATGIFNAVRVSADGIAIAIAGAVLAMLIQGGLFDALPSVTNTQQMIEAANRAALGDVNSAATLLPGQRQLTLQIYDQAFRHLLYILAIASAATAILIFMLLGRLHAHNSAAEQT